MLRQAITRHARLALARLPIEQRKDSPMVSHLGLMRRYNASVSFSFRLGLGWEWLKAGEGCGEIRAEMRVR